MEELRIAWDFILQIIRDHGKIILSIILALGIWVLRRMVLQVITKRHEDIKIRYRWRKGTTYVSFVLAFILIGRIWINGVDSLTTYFGLLTAGLAVALQAPIVNLAGWAFIMWRRPFVVGDRIQIGEMRGDVVDVRIFLFTVMELGEWVNADQSTGRLVHIPNGQVFQVNIANYSQGFEYIWDEIPVLITFESNWKKAKGILAEIAKRHDVEEEAAERIRLAAQRYLIYYKNISPMVYTAVQDSGVELTMRFLVVPKKRRGTRMAIWEDVLEAFSEHDDIHLAYPTIRYYGNTREGRSGTGGPKPKPLSEATSQAIPHGEPANQTPRKLTESD